LAKQDSPLAFYLAGAYTLLAIYGSLYPFAGWHDSGAPLTSFLTAGWPRYTTDFDVIGNFAAYVPLGFLWATALQPRLGPAIAVFAAFAIGVVSSLTLETLQHFLPSRVPSNLDLACNSAGALIGGLSGARWGRAMLDGGRLHDLRQRYFIPGTVADAGLLLIWLWLLTQLHPETLLFGNGEVRDLFDIPAPLAYSAEGFARIEAVIVASHALAIGLIVTLVVRSWRPELPVIVVGTGLLAKSFALSLMMSGSAGFAWATPGSLTGLSAGLLLWLLAVPLQARWQRALAALSLLLGTTLVNIAPENPYLANTFQLWNPGQFLNFHGLTRLTSNLWPFLALPWLIVLRTDHEQ
jgi:VanZ family protein